MSTRLPSFSDFSPDILGGDLRPCLLAIRNAGGDDAAVTEQWAVSYFKGKHNKRSTNNIPSTLGSTGLTVKGKRPMSLTDFGDRVADAPSPREATEIFVKEMLQSHNGMKLLDGIRELTARGTRVTKATLKAELKRLGVSDLSTGTTDHLTLMNWMREIGLVAGPIGHPGIDDSVLRKLVGYSSTEHDEFAQLTTGQQVFLSLLRRRHITEAGPFLAAHLIQECVSKYPHHFKDDQFARDVRMPLEAAGWITVTDLPKGRQGGKSGRIIGSSKLLGIPVDFFAPDFSRTIPADLVKRIRTPLEEIQRDLFQKENKNKAGIALELLAVRMILDLGLNPRHFRLRSSESAYAEVDVTADGQHLLFSRWVFQCKRLTGGKVGLSDVAKEVGIAVYTKAHVVAVVTTTDFSSDAIEYAREVSQATHLQFLLVRGDMVRRYLKNGAPALYEYVLENAGNVMQQKRVQPVEVPK